MRKTVFAAMLLIVMIAGCTGGPKKGQTVDLSATPFIGGTAGLSADFVDFRADVFDGGRDPFDVVVKLDNKGEYTVPASRVRVKLSGVNPAEFGKLEEDLIKSAPDDLIGTNTDAQGNILPSTPVFIEFTGLNHLFQTCETGSPSEYGQIEETFAPAALEAVTSWIRKRTGLDGVR